MPTAQNLMWAERATKLHAEGVNNKRDMIAALNKLHSKAGVREPADLLKSAIKGNFVWTESRKEPSVEECRKVLKNKTAQKRKEMAAIAKEFRDKKSILKGYSTNIFYTHLKTHFINIDKRDGTNYIGKKCSTSALEAQLMSGGFVR